MSIYETLFLDSVLSGDPIAPYGVKSRDLLESAVSRQYTGFDGRLKYATAVSNAATLCFGICCNHAFHNGNKRTGLVSMLCHLDRNDWTFEESVSQDELYEVMIRLASSPENRRRNSDEDVDELTKWVRKRARRIATGERNITCRQLRTLLNNFGLELENHDGNHIDVVRYSKSSGFFGIGAKTRRERMMRIPYARDGAPVGRSTLRALRERCELTEAYGIDSTTFYSHSRPADYFVTRYRSTLRRLART